MKNIFPLMLIVAFVPTVFGKEYINEQYGIHLSVPDDWKIVNYEDLSPRRQQRLKEIYSPFQTLAVCSITRPDTWNCTTVIIQYMPAYENFRFDDAVRELRSDFGKEMMITSAELLALDVAGRDLKSYRVVDTDSGFDRRRNKAFGKIIYQKGDKPDFVSMAIKLLVEDGLVTLRCFSFGTEVDNFEKTIAGITNSLKFDPRPDESSATAHQETKKDSGLSKEQVFDLIWKWSPIVLIALIVFRFVKAWLDR